MNDLLKAKLRKQLLNIGQQLDQQEIKKWDKAIIDHVLDWWTAASYKSMAGYYPIYHEPNLMPLCEVLFDQGVILSLPRINEVKHKLEFLHWKPHDILLSNRYSILEPNQNAQCICPELVFLPCLGFTDQGFRLGYGKGYYDRTLQQLPHVIKIGIAYDCNQCDMMPESHDIRLDYMITESMIYHF